MSFTTYRSKTRLNTFATVVCAIFAGTFLGHSETYFTEAIPLAPYPIIVNCTIDGTAKKLMLDTGAGYIAMNKEYERGKSSVLGRGKSPSGETFTIPTGIGPTIKIQSLKITKPTCVFPDLTGVTSQLGSQVVGILGMAPHLAQAKLYFDNGKSLLTVHSGDWLIAGSSKKISLIKSAETPVFPAKICGHDVKLIVDTGSTVGLTLPKEVFDKLVAEGAIKKLNGGLDAITATGKSQLELGVFLKGKLMGEPLRGVEVLVGRDLGSIGLPWLKKFNFEIAFSDRVMRYRPVKTK